MNRRGFTLVELLVALMLGSLVLTAIYTTIVRTQRSSHAMAMQIDVQQNLRAGVQYASAALRELDAHDQDLNTIQASTVRFRSTQWAGSLCRDPVPGFAGLSVAIDRSPYFGIRQPVSQDSIMFFADGDPNTRADDQWLFGGVLLVGATTCDDGSPAIRLIASINASSGGNAALVALATTGAPVRGFQMEELALTQQGGRWWLAQRIAPRGGTYGTSQPLVGPLSNGGLVFTYYDAAGLVTANPLQVASVQIQLRAESPEPAWNSAGVVDFVRDSLVTRVALRNNARF